MIKRQKQVKKELTKNQMILLILALIATGISALFLFKIYNSNAGEHKPSEFPTEKKEIKIKVVDDLNIIKKGLMYEFLQKNYTVIESDEPDYLLYSVFGDEHLDYQNCVRIFWTGENIAPDMNLCDYAISFEHMDYSDRHIRIPLWILYKSSAAGMQNKHKIDKNFLNSKTEFCSFVYSHGGEGSIREKFFKSLNARYKKVSSGGEFLNNIGQSIGKNTRDSNVKNEFERKHKFSITFENSSHPGYSTEKLADAFTAQTVPIYWGDPTIGKTFNTKAFINVHDYNSIDEVIDKIIEIDSNDDLYLRMIKEPALIEKNYVENTLTSLEKFFKNIFDQEYSKAFRRNTGVWGTKYFENMKSLKNILRSK